MPSGRTASDSSRLGARLREIVPIGSHAGILRLFVGGSFHRNEQFRDFALEAGQRAFAGEHIRVVQFGDGAVGSMHGHGFGIRGDHAIQRVLRR